MLELENRVALITGSSRGIGAACAKMMARGGADIVINYHKDELAAAQTADVVSSFGRKCMVIQADVSIPKEIDRLVGAAIKNFGRIDILVNNAGFHLTKTIPIEELTIEDWQKSININLASQLWCIKAVLGSMRTNHWGRIINMSSITSQRGSISGDVCYTVTKAGVNGLTRALYWQLGQSNITINTVSPGTIDTPGTRRVLPDQNTVQEYIRKIPLGRIGTADEVAEMVYFLSTERASYITGQLISVNGGAYI